MAQAETFDRAGAVRYALENNPEMRIADLAIERAKSRLRWSGRLENPEFEFSATNDSIGLDDDEAVYEIAFSQKFPLTSRLKDQRKVREIQVLLAEAEIAEQKRLLAHEVDQVATEILALREKSALQTELVELNAEIAKFLKLQVEAGEASSLDVVQARLQGRTLNREVAAISVKLDELTLQLTRKLGIAPDTPIKLRGTLSMPNSKPAAAVAIDPILVRRPDHGAKLIQSDLAQAELMLAHSSRFEDVAVKLFLEREHAVDAPDGLERNTFAGIGFSIPLPIRNKNEEGIELAKIDLAAAQETIEASEFAIRSDVNLALKARRAAWTLATEASGEILELAETNLAEFQTAYKNGQASLVQVQRAQEQLLEIRTASADLEHDYHLAETAVRFATAHFQKP